MRLQAILILAFPLVVYLALCSDDKQIRLLRKVLLVLYSLAILVPTIFARSAETGAADRSVKRTKVKAASASFRNNSALLPVFINPRLLLDVIRMLIPNCLTAPPSDRRVGE